MRYISRLVGKISGTDFAAVSVVRAQIPVTWPRVAPTDWQRQRQRPNVEANVPAHNALCCSGTTMTTHKTCLAAVGEEKKSPGLSGQAPLIGV